MTTLVTETTKLRKKMTVRLKKKMLAQNNTTHGNKELTGSELVRKFVTFHFFFPVGQHHPETGIPLLTRENGLLNYQANCDKVLCYHMF